MLEKLLCSNEEPSGSITQSTKSACQDIPDLEEFVHNFYSGYPNCKEFIVDFYTVTKNTGNNMDEVASDVIQSLDKGNDKVTNEKREQNREERRKNTEARSTEREELNISSDGCDNATCNSSDSEKSDGEDVGEQVRYERDELVNASLRDDGQSPRDRDFISNRDVACVNNRSENTSSMIRSDPTKLDDIARDLAASGVSSTVQDTTIDMRGNEENFIASEITRVLESSGNIEIPQTTQYLLNQVSRENTPIVNSETAHMQNSLPDLDAKKLISEANKTLSNLLLDGGECQNEISEQTDSGICTVISSENTSLYDKSPEEKKTFANEIQQEEGARVSDEEEDTQENTSYSCSNLSSPTKRRNLDAVSENSCVCGTRNAKAVTVPVDHSIQVSNLHANVEESSKNIPQISSNFDGTNEEFIGVAYGNGHLTLCDSNQSTFQINYSENWENLNLNIDASSSRKEFWGDLKCENCPSTSQNIDKIGNQIERYAQDKKKAREERQRRRHHHKMDRNTLQKFRHGRLGEKRQGLQVMRSATSTESSRLAYNEIFDFLSYIFYFIFI